MAEKKLVPLKEMTEQVLVEKVGGLLARGCSKARIKRALGWSQGKLMRLLEKYPDIIRRIHEEVRRMAALERPRNLTRLMELREQDDNLETARKAAGDIDALAGVVKERHDAGVSITILGAENVTVGGGGVSGSDLRAIAEELAEKIGLDRKIINAEFSLDPAREGAFGVTGGSEGSAPSGDKAGPGSQAAESA